MKRRCPIAYLLTFAAMSTIAGCAHGAQTYNSTAAPGTTVVSFPNSYDRNWTTVLLSNPRASVAGVAANVLDVTAYHGQQGFDQLSIDQIGNVGVRGALYTRSSRNEKTAIHRYTDDAVRLLGGVHIVSYHYRDESVTEPLHIGLIAEDAPAPLVGRRRDSFNVTNAVAINMAATQQLTARIDALTRHVASLERQLRDARSHKTGASR